MTASYQYDLLLKNGHVIDPLNHIDGKMDVAIAGGKVAAVQLDLNPALAAQTVDVAGHYVTPGILDIHVHVYHTREPEGISVNMRGGGHGERRCNARAVTGASRAPSRRRW